MEGKNNSNVVVILLVVIILGLVGFIVYDKVLSKDNNNVILNNEENDKLNTTNNNNNSDNINNITMLTNIGKQCEKGCSKTVANKTDDVLIYASKYELKVNNNNIVKFEQDSPSSITQVSIYDDIIITMQQESLSSSIVIYSINGVKLKEIRSFTDEQSRMFITTLGYDDKQDFIVDDNGKISFKGTKHPRGTANSYIADDGNIIDLCEQGEKISDEAIVSGMFSLNYLKNNTFSEIKNINIDTRVKDIKRCS